MKNKNWAERIEQDTDHISAQHYNKKNSFNKEYLWEIISLAPGIPRQLGIQGSLPSGAMKMLKWILF